MIKIDQIPKGLRTEYLFNCINCKKTYKFLAQANNFPEYETEIYFECDCGNFVELILPVN